MHGGARVLVHLVVDAEDQQRHVTVAQDRQLHGLLDEAILALGEGRLAVALVREALDLDLVPAHCCCQARRARVSETIIITRTTSTASSSATERHNEVPRRTDY